MFIGAVITYTLDFVGAQLGHKKLADHFDQHHCFLKISQAQLFLIAFVASKRHGSTKRPKATHETNAVPSSRYCWRSEKGENFRLRIS